MRQAATLAALAAWLWAKYTKLTAATAAIATHLPVWLWWLGSVLALVFGHTARNQIIASGGRQTGEGLAIAGIVLGWIGIATFVWLALILGSLTTIIP